MFYDTVLTKGVIYLEATFVKHTFPPIYDKNSRLLLLGTVPSVKSRETDFYYGHPQNRFWKVLSAICKAPLPQTKQQKIDFLLRHHIAIYDVVDSCNIIGSSDSSIKDVTPVNLQPILQTTGDIPIFANGATAEKLYKKYLYPITNRPIVKLPSTSPANATWHFADLVLFWSDALKILQN